MEKGGLTTSNCIHVTLRVKSWIFLILMLLLFLTVDGWILLQIAALLQLNLADLIKLFLIYTIINESMFHTGPDCINILGIPLVSDYLRMQTWT